jgi:hypothetical protein
VWKSTSKKYDYSFNSKRTLSKVIWLDPRGSISHRVCYFSLRQRIRTGSDRLYLKIKLSGRQTDRTPTSSVDVKDAWSCHFSPPHTSSCYGAYLSTKRTFHFKSCGLKLLWSSFCVYLTTIFKLHWLYSVK